MTKYILGYLKYTLNAKLVYHRSDSKKVTTYTYVDVDFANTPERKSVSEMTLSINYYLIVW
jgi:cytochrome c oxidase assembly protein Cox11